MAKNLEVKFLGETFSFSNKAARDLFLKVKDSVGRGAVIKAKSENPGGLTVEVLNALVEASKKKDPRKDLREDGSFKCSFFHAGTGGQVKAQAWTLTKKESGEVVTDRDGNPIIAGPFFVTSVHRIEELIPENEAVRNRIITSMRATTIAVTGKSAEEVAEMQALIGLICGFHRSDKVGGAEIQEKYRQIFRRTTGKLEAIAQREKLEAYIAEMAGNFAARNEEASALAGAKDRKFQKGRRGGNSGSDGSGEKRFQFETSFGNTTFGARTEGEVRIYKQLADEFKGRELEFSKLSVEDLVARGVNPNVAPVLTRRVRQSLESTATIGDRAAANEERDRREKVQRRDRREKVTKHRKNNIRFEGEEDEN